MGSDRDPESDREPAPDPDAGSDLDARAVAQRLAVLPDRRMREARLCELVERIDPADAAWLLDTFATAGRGAGPPFDVSLLAAVDLGAGERLDYQRRRAIFEAADAHGLVSCKELLLSTEAAEDDDKAAAPRALVPGTRPLTLGERKSLARSWDRQTLERLVTDPHADVVALLLSNPHVTEGDILRIATGRRSSAEVLKLVLISPRWGRSPRVRRALIRNPRMPLSETLRLVGLLNQVELRELAADPSLPLRLVAAVQRRLRPVT